MPLDDPEPFAEFRSGPGLDVACYVWGRRDPESMMAEFGRDGFRMPIAAAWIDSRRTNAELLSWWDLCREMGWEESLGGFVDAPVREYCAREPDRGELLAFLRRAPYAGVEAALKYFARTLAAGEPLEIPLPPVADEFSEERLAWGRDQFPRLMDHLSVTLRDLGEHEVLDACEELRRRDLQSAVHWLAVEFWICQHGPDNVDRLSPKYGSLGGYPAIRRLAAVLPQDRRDAWDPWFESNFGSFVMARFVEWLQPENRDWLLGSFADVEFDRWFRHEDAICALQGWLSKAPRAEVEEWAARPQLPFWQQLMCDRALHAPEPLRPPPVLSFMQELEFDLRLVDPLSIRGE